jgi:hypothetical protein
MSEREMDRNIITAGAAAARNRARAAEFRQAVKDFAETAAPDASLFPGTLGGELPIDLQKADHWNERILKAVPIEAITAYVALDKGTQILAPEGPLSASSGWPWRWSSVSCSTLPI